MEMIVYDEKKKKLKVRLDELLKATEDEKYEWDPDYKKEINIKLAALKEIKDEILKEEEKWREILKEPFKLDVYDDTMEQKRGELVELRRSYKLHAIKKEQYEQLKLE